MNSIFLLVSGYLIVIHEAAVNLATFVAFLLMDVDGRNLLTRIRRGSLHYLKHSLILVEGSRGNIVCVDGE